MSDDKTVVAEQKADTTTSGQTRSAPVLLQYDSGAAGKRFLLIGDEIVVGRRADRVQVWIDDASVSREHCKIKFEGTHATVIDLGSLNHTYVNDQNVETRAELVHGDMLRVGNVRLKYFAHGSADQLLFDRIYRMAVTDRMLEIFRKEFLLERLDEEFRLAKVSHDELSLAFFDLDKFKNINDTYGHDAGDFILKEVCRLVKTQLRASDVFGRYGGEEFCVILPRTGIDAAFNWCEAVRVEIEQAALDYEGIIIPVTISIGIASWNETIASPQDLIKVADMLVYQSKKEGRNRVSRP